MLRSHPVTASIAAAPVTAIVSTVAEATPELFI